MSSDKRYVYLYSDGEEAGYFFAEWPEVWIKGALSTVIRAVALGGGVDEVSFYSCFNVVELEEPPEGEGWEEGLSSICNAEPVHGIRGDKVTFSISPRNITASLTCRNKYTERTYTSSEILVYELA